MIVESDGHRPTIAPDASIAATAVISGDVTVGAGCSIGHGAIVVAEGGPVVLGRSCVVMDTAVVRGVPGRVMRLGHHVLVGPQG